MGWGRLGWLWEKEDATFEVSQDQTLLCFVTLPRGVRLNFPRHSSVKY